MMERGRNVRKWLLGEIHKGGMIHKEGEIHREGEIQKEGVIHKEMESNWVGKWDYHKEGGI